MFRVRVSEFKGRVMTKSVRWVAVLLACSLAGCNAQNPFGVGAGNAELQAAVEPISANVPPVADDLGRAKEYFRNRNFGLAEKHFRLAIEQSGTDVEAWLGLAATHDQLGRFDLADREYAQVQRRSGVTFELLNNRGYSYMLRGNLARARQDFNAAQRMDPDSAFVRNNLNELNAKASGRG
jgi:Flp pilus assembly protein TadD